MSMLPDDVPDSYNFDVVVDASWTLCFRQIRLCIFWHCVVVGLAFPLSRWYDKHIKTPTEAGRYHEWKNKLLGDKVQAPDTDYISFSLILGTLNTLFSAYTVCCWVDSVSTWLSFSYFRVFSLYRHACNIFFLHSQSVNRNVLLIDLNEISQQVIKTVLKFIAMIVIMAGSMFVLEMLGDIEGLEDTFFHAEMGEISFASMIYMIMITISTVGYGDLSPTTLLGRILIMGCILYGVVFFSRETARLLELQQLENTGKGRYIPCRKGQDSKHVVVFGGAIERDCSKIVQTLLTELCDPHNSTSGPDVSPEVVLMGNSEPPESLRKLLKSTATYADKVFLLQGSVFNEEDMERCRLKECKMLFVLPNLNTSNPDDEDRFGIMLIANILKVHPDIHFRLILLRPQSRILAQRFKIRREVCFAIYEFKAHVLAQNVRCLGISTMLLGLAQAPKAVPSWVYEHYPWIAKFEEAARHKVFGAQLRTAYAGRAFNESAKKVYAKTGALLVACQIEGRIFTNPGSDFNVDSSTVVFLIAQSEEQIESVITAGQKWRANFSTARRTMMKTVRDTKMSFRANSFSAKGRYALGGNGIVENDTAHGTVPPWVEGSSRDLMPGFVGPDAMDSSLNRSPTMKKHINEKKKQKKLRQSFVGHSCFQRPRVLSRFAQAENCEQEREEEPSSSTDGSFHLPGATVNKLQQKQSAALNFHGAANVLRAFQPKSVPVGQLLPAVMKSNHGHIVILAVGELLTQQMVAFIKPLRSPYMMVWQEIVIVTNIHLPDNLFNTFKGVHIVHGAPHQYEALAKAALEDAFRVIILDGYTPKMEPAMMAMEKSLLDQNTIVCNSVLQSYLEHFPDHSVSALSVLHNPECIKQLDNQDISIEPDDGPENQTMTRSRASVRRRRKGNNTRLARKQKRPAHFIMHRIASTLSGTVMQKRPPLRRVLPPHLHPQFVSGCSMPLSDLVSWFAHEYHTPGFMELMEAFLLPETGGMDENNVMPSMLWMVATTELQHYDTWEEVVNFCMEGGAIPMALSRSIAEDLEISGGEDGETQDHSSGRAHQPDKASLKRFVVTNPPKGEKLALHDQVLVLASPRWAYTHCISLSIIEMFHVARETTNVKKVLWAWRDYVHNATLERRLSMGAESEHGEFGGGLTELATGTTKSEPSTGVELENRKLISSLLQLINKHKKGSSPTKQRRKFACTEERLISRIVGDTSDRSEGKMQDPANRFRCERKASTHALGANIAQISFARSIKNGEKESGMAKGGVENM
ncbi:hypothetical protein CYMTET_4832 [Cymbomonas tetramitiformis]|uniref:Calcium-activated potassium channel subunit alpha-1 n=1 Tax=Cymbomonas tetramitiformis TaxID=36881 RepID=A0AAE0H0L3_9CHLO|nr:hypothetical protein CYMTET_4832 [Cymbomonas tetramitiformis]